MQPSKNMAPDHFQWELKDGLGIITLNRPERKNPLTFDSYAELRDTFRDFSYTDEIRAVIINGAGGNFCSGGDVHEIIGPLTKMNMKELLAFTRMTGDLVKAIRACPQPVIAAVWESRPAVNSLLAKRTGRSIIERDAATTGRPVGPVPVGR